MEHHFGGWGAAENFELTPLSGPVDLWDSDSPDAFAQSQRVSVRARGMARRASRVLPSVTILSKV